MGADTTLSLPDIITVAWGLYKSIFIKLVIIVMVVMFPLALFHILTIEQLINTNNDIYVTRGVSLFISMIEYIPALMISMLAARQIDTGESPLFEVIASTLLRLFKVVVTIIIVAICLFAPSVFVGTCVFFLITKGGDSTTAKVIALILSYMLIIPSVIYLVTFMIYWMFAPLVTLLRGKWFLSSMKYSFSLVRSNWWRVLLFGVILAAVMTLLYFAGMASAGNGLLILIFLCLGMLVLGFVQTVYVTVFHTLEQNSGVKP